MPSYPTPLELFAQFPRFWSKATIGNPDECWLWQASLNPTGYGKFRYQGESRLAHHIAYEQCTGPIPPNLILDHLCYTRACINPNHLEAVTQGENVRRAAKLITSCPKGHPYDAENTYYRPSRNARRCRTCHREQERERWKAGRAPFSASPPSSSRCW